MTTSVFFSVIIPTFNQANLLSKALSSVLSQSFKNYEIIVIDNFSDDSTYDIVKSFENTNLIYKKIKNNGVIAKSRNEGIKISNGKWLAFLDSDDYWYPERLEVVSNLLKENDNYEVICTDELIVDKIRGKKKIWNYGPFTNDFYKHLLEKGNCVSTSASIVKKEFLLKQNILFNEQSNFITAEDYDFFMNLAFRKAKFKFIPRVLGEHLFHDQSQSSKYKNHIVAVKSVVKHHTFNVQSFSENKQKLWDSLKINFWFMDFVYLLGHKKKYIRSFIMLIKIFLYFPIKTSSFVFFKLKKKLFTYK